MAFIQVAAPFGQRVGQVLSADNAVPERHIVIEIIRKAAPLLSLKPPVIATLEAMLSCLAPKRTHHTVFASNATLSFRRSGISERSIRRHVATLQEIGLLVRHDSPNKKRYTRHNANEGKSLRFGFDLSPLFERLHELSDLAATAAKQQEQINYLRCKLRAAINIALTQDPENEDALLGLKLLRRKLSLEQLETLLETHQTPPAEAAADHNVSNKNSTDLSANDGQFVRHHHKSNKELNDKKETSSEPSSPHPANETLNLAELIAACPQAMEFSLRNIETPADVIAHGRSLAPMIGIDRANYQAAEHSIGPYHAAISVWIMTQFHERIQQVGAYFRSVTSGRNSANFDPVRLIKRMSNQTGFSLQRA
ncbi:plasmid replication protein RepC [Thioclava indica]|uniref:Uncharacterized protein n=1 Tax=Thioclava indica TaxID=1353528 RepID=A0A074KEJ7_9RHOB|nr:plasmid replication protein RepC [Thioclava indica]KEO59992.1 hypothetical protein DT23_14805 [Thioclava indica]